MVGQSASLERPISPPPARRARQAPTEESQRKQDAPVYPNQQPSQKPSLAAIEAGQVVIDDHLAYFSTHLRAVHRDTGTLQPLLPRLSIREFVDLYRRNLNPHGHHFVVHQHDHPISGM